MTTADDQDIEATVGAPLPRTAFGVLVILGLIGAVLLANGRWDYPELHTILDTAMALLSGALGLLLWDIGTQTGRPLYKELALSFGATFLLEIAHVLVTVEWFGPLAPIAAAKGFLRPATWPPAAHLLPIGIGWTLGYGQRSQSSTRVFAGALLVLAAGLFLAFQRLPTYVPPGLFGITRPALVLAPLLWGAVAVSAWRQRTRDRMALPLVWMAAVLVLANAIMAYSRAPADGVAMTAHLGRVSGYLVLLLSVMQMASQDVRERVLAEDNLRRSEARYKTLADNATDMITLQDTEFRGEYVSPASFRMLGYTPGEIIASTAGDLMHPDDVDGYQQRLAALNAEFPHATSIHRLRHRNGTYIWAEASLRLVSGAEDGPPRILTVVRDISERKQAEDATARLQALLSDAIESMRDGIALYDAEDRLVLTNRALTQHAGAVSHLFTPGTTYATIVRGYWPETEFASDPTLFEALLAAQIDRHRLADGTPDETHANDGRWFHTRHFRTSEGGTLTVSSDVSVSKQAEIQIEAARAAADSANRAKSAFLASMSHEIRTPISAVLGFADLLLDSGLGEEQRAQATMLRDAGRSLLAIVNDILDLSKIEAGKLEIEQIAMSPETVMDGVASILKAQVAAKGLELRIVSASSLPRWIIGDPTRIRQILLNLAGNALKFTQSGHIAIRTRRESDSGRDFLRFEVEDSGIGIPADRQHLLFQDFSQVDSSTSRRFGGTGLGLSICRRLAEAMGGTIGVASEPGLGSTFWFTIRCQETEPPEEMVKTSERAAANALARRILVAEDMPMNQIIIEAYLKRAGHQVKLVGDGSAAVDAIQHGSYDLVLMDMEMPKMDGLTATRAIRALGHEVPIIALTANAMQGDLERCKAAGMNDFMSKPIDRDALVAKIGLWSAGRSAPLAETPHPAQAIVDASILAELEKTLGPANMPAMSGMFRAQLEKMTTLLRDGGDHAQLGRAAHDLTSVAGSFGCTQLMNLSRRLSTVVRGDDPSGISELKAEMVTAVRLTIAAVDERFPAQAENAVQQ